MSLTARPKIKPYQKKRQAQHHRHSKNYIRAYLPYLPMLSIILVGIAIDHTWTGSAGSASLGNAANGSDNTLLATVTGSSSTSLLYGVILVSFAAFAAFVVIYWLKVSRWLSKGKAYAVNHPWIDASLVFIFTAGTILTRTGH